jgi:hypothetical protein
MTHKGVIQADQCQNSGTRNTKLESLTSATSSEGYQQRSAEYR